MAENKLDAGKLIVIGGMARSGTTFLYHNFQHHPDIYVPNRKELAFFAYNRDRSNEWYQSFFKGIKEESCAVDISPGYFMDPHAAGLISAYGKDVRVILGIRRPLDWIYSMYGHYDDMFSVPPFREFLNGCTLKREGRDYHLEFRNQKIRKTTEKYLETFGKNLLLYDFSLLQKDPLRLLCEIETFMGVSAFFNKDNIISGKVHARGEGGAKSVSRMLNSIPGLATLISRLVPLSLLMAIRRKVEAPQMKSERQGRKTADMHLSDEDRQYAADILKDDEDYYHSLFINGPIINGRYTV